MTLFPEPLAPEALRWRFDKSESLDLDGGKLSKEIFIGQERAERAMAFGLGMSSNEFNLYVSGPPGTGKYTMCRSYCERLACETDVPDSIAFVHNFSDSDRPLWLTFPAGIAVEFQGDMAMLVTELQESIPKAFEADAHESARKEIVESVQTQQRQRLEALEEKGRAVNFAIQMSQAGLNVIPLIDGKNATAEQFENLPEEERKRYEENRNSLATPISEFVKETRNLEKEVRARMRKLDENIALTAVKGPMDDLRDKYASFEKTISFLDMVERHILGNFSTFQNTEELGGAEAAPMMMMRPPKDENPFRVYEVNVVVDNSALECAPVVYESNPNFNNLFGRIERRAHFGTYTTDFTLVRAGSIVQASGGFLILNALDVLTNPGVWPALKRAIRTRCVRIEDLGETFGWSQGTIKPEPIPVNVKVLLMGSPMIYYLLLRQDEDFGKLFKVKADFSSVIKRTPASLRDFRAFVEFHRAEDGLLPFSDDAMARVLEASSRMVSDQSRLSAQFGELRELLLEADHWARQEEAQRVEAKHIICAEDEKRFRADLLDERLRDQIIEGHVMIDVEGEVIGQINGLAVLSMGDFSFGKPSRITAQTFMGDRGVINIERESKLSGNIHDKGMLILQGYLGATYARNHPLALSASITFEQNYGGVDVRESISGAVAVKLKDPVFESQTKNKLGNNDVRGWIVSDVRSAVVDFLHKNQTTALQIQEKISQNERLRKELNAVKKEAKDAARKIAIKIPHFKDCKFHFGQKKLGDESTIFITEGPSAAGSMVSARDPLTQSIFGLKGVPLNVFGRPKAVIYKNEELYNLMMALGIEDSI
ncbi:MAG: AAA family ATPase, partial [Nitrospinaceae bacterium]|nr:AAA family ATPase [Nitrospinaceae bacterium]